MFPIIPYNLNQSSRMITYSEVYSNSSSSRMQKVIAACDLPRDVISEPIDPESICGKQENLYKQFEVELNNQNRVTLKAPDGQTDVHWMRRIKLADDCHSYNAKLCVEESDESKNTLVIQITKPIRVGQELLLWFSEDILANLQMAFLIPANIQGQKKYVCHLCSELFEYPNPLKLHLTLNCNKYHTSILWDRLFQFVNTHHKNCSNIPFGFQLKIDDHITTPTEKYSILNLSKSADSSKISTIDLNKLSTTILPSSCSPNQVRSATSLSPTHEMTRPLSEPLSHSSAFKPYPAMKKLSQNNNTIRLSQSLSSFSTLSENLPTNLPNGIIPQNFPSPFSFNHAAQMETLVSNLGKSKQGHLCIYCGKCYSRKYGLKIHIRTHTGYKPLKCKYCLRPFGDPSNLNKHVRLHAEGDTPYKCELCGKVLVRRRDLERHLRSRHIEDKIDETANSSSDHSDD